MSDGAHSGEAATARSETLYSSRGRARPTIWKRRVARGGWTLITLWGKLCPIISAAHNYSGSLVVKNLMLCRWFDIFLTAEKFAKQACHTTLYLTSYIAVPDCQRHDGFCREPASCSISHVPATVAALRQTPCTTLTIHNYRSQPLHRRVRHDVIPSSYPNINPLLSTGLTF